MANRTPKGDQRRAKILSRALEIAARKGLAELTIGGLAKELKMSKSGLFAHFGSKQSLALATVDRASEIFREEVILPVQDNKEGLERLWNLCDLWLEHMERGISRGNYFFVGAFFQYGWQGGAVPNRIRVVVNEWMRALRDCIEEAWKWREIRPDADLTRSSVELNAVLVGAYWALLLEEHEGSWMQIVGEYEASWGAREQIVKILATIAGKNVPASAFESVKAWKRYLKQRER